VKPRSIATKLSLTIGLLVAASLGVVGILAVTSSRASLQQHAQAANKTAAALAARAVEEYVADAARIINEAAGRPSLGRGLHDANWAETASVLKNFLKNFSQFDYVFVLDPSGILRVRVPHAETVGQNFSFR
jgi:sensor domain CHASE-containing protein